MKQKSEIRWLFIGITATMFALLSLAVAAEKSVYLPIIGNASGYKIGDTGPAGGKVFFVSSDGQHGLEAAPSDQSTGIRWDYGTFLNTEAVGDGIGAGEMNTTLIVAIQGGYSPSYAAGLCANYEYNEYGDWYLPSKKELNLLFEQKDIVGGFIGSYYWSSTEYTSSSASGQNFGSDSVVQLNIAKWAELRVRAIRAF